MKQELLIIEFEYQDPAGIDSMLLRSLSNEILMKILNITILESGLEIQRL